MDGYESSSYWLDLVRDDLKAAKAMLGSSLYLYTGFMCHQAIEKSLKAVIAKAGVVPPFIHNLQRLSLISGLDDLMDEAQHLLLAELMPLNVEARYPAQKQELLNALTEEYCTLLIKKTEALAEWIKSRL